MIKYYDRHTNKIEIEKVAGERYLNWTYSSPIGLSLLELLIKKKWFTAIYGWFCDQKLSKSNIAEFIKNYNIDMSLSENPIEKYNNFNDFFTRKLKPEARPIDKTPNSFISPGDGRLLAYENIDLDKIVQVKGFTYKLRELIEDEKTAETFKGGTCIILRLCPTDYHRFHFTDDGTCGRTVKIKGNYYSVNPAALEKIPKLFCQNKREWSLFHSKNFGMILHVEVGATCVGSIIQTYTPDKEVRKGDEKGYFKFGGSTTILFLEKGIITIDKDIMDHTKEGIESLVYMGETIGTKK